MAGNVFFSLLHACNTKKAATMTNNNHYHLIITSNNHSSTTASWVLDLPLISDSSSIPNVMI